MRRMRRTTWAPSPGNTAGRTTICWDWNVALRQPYRQRPDQDLPQHHQRRGLLRQRQSRQQHLGLRRRPARLSARYPRHRRLQHDALQCRRLAQRGDLRVRRVPGRREHVRQPRQFQHHDAQRRAHRVRRLRAVEAELLDLARGRQRDPLRPLRSAFADGGDQWRRRPFLAEDHRRRDAGGRLYALCQLCRRLSRARRSRRR